MCGGSGIHSEWLCVKDQPVTIKLLGGDLEIFWDQQKNTVFMTGPAEVVFDGEIKL